MNDQTYLEMKGMIDRDSPILGCKADGEVIIPDLIKWFWCKEHLTSAISALEQIKNKGTCQGIDSNILDNLSKIGLIK